MAARVPSVTWEWLDCIFHTLYADGSDDRLETRFRTAESKPGRIVNVAPVYKNGPVDKDLAARPAGPGTGVWAHKSAALAQRADLQWLPLEVSKRELYGTGPCTPESAAKEFPKYKFKMCSWTSETWKTRHPFCCGHHLLPKPQAWTVDPVCVCISRLRFPKCSVYDLVLSVFNSWKC